MKKGFWTAVTDIIRSTDVVLEVLDARMPEITRNPELESYAAKLGKVVVLVFNKSDVVSKSAIGKIKNEYKDIYHVVVSCKHSYGIRDLIKAIKIRIRAKQIRVAVIGYPNTGKSSLINRLSRGARAKTSAESGLTRGIQWITGKSGLMLFDTPGVVPYKERDEVRLGLVSGISPAKLKDPDIVAYELIKLIKINNPLALEKEYGISSSLEPEEILEEFGKKRKMLMKGGVVDERRASIHLLIDWHNGKIKF